MRDKLSSLGAVYWHFPVLAGRTATTLAGRRESKKEKNSSIPVVNLRIQMESQVIWETKGQREYLIFSSTKPLAREMLVALCIIVRPGYLTALFTS